MSNATSIAVLIETTPALALQDTEAREQLFSHIENEVNTFAYDVTTPSGRKAIGSLAYKISRTKTAIDDAGKLLIEDAQKIVKATNDERKAVRDRLDLLRDTARKPLDDWEEGERKRIAHCEAVIDEFKRAAVVVMADTSDGLGRRIAHIEALVIGRDEFGDYFDVAIDARQATVAILKGALERIALDEANLKELERLRAEQARRDEVNAAEEAERQAAANHAANIRAQIQHIIDCGRGFIGGKQYPLVILRRELEEKVVIDDSFGDQRAEAEAALAAALQSIATMEESARQQAEADEAQRVAEAEAAVLQREQDRRAAEQAQADADAAARTADTEHRSAIMGAAKEALMEHGGIGEDRARKIVLAIAAGNVPNVLIRF